MQATVISVAYNTKAPWAVRTLVWKDTYKLSYYKTKSGAVRAARKLNGSK
jgi:hypothetical protein